MIFAAARLLSFRAALVVLPLPLWLAGCQVDLTEPAGTAGVLGAARFTHSLSGELGPTPVAVGSVFAVAASSDGCDSLAEQCDLSGTLAVAAANTELVRVTLRADGNYGVEALAAGSTVLWALNSRDEVSSCRP